MKGGLQHLYVKVSVLMERYHCEEEDRIYENIGAKVLENWHSDHGDDHEGDMNAASSELGAKLDKILDHSGKGTRSWVPELKELVDSMSVADFASHGKKICLFLLSKEDKSKKVHAKPKSKDAPKKKHHKKAKSAMPPVRKIERRDENDYLCRKIFFPRWLPSICNEE